MKKFIIIFVVILLAGIAYWQLYYKPQSMDISNFLEMVTVDKGNVYKQISSNGTIEPRNSVDVGTQVSGIIEEIFVDYNDEVKKGQLIATLDTYLLNEEVKETKATLDSAIVREKIAKLNYDRNVQLYKDGYISKTEQEEYEVALSSAKAEKARANANYNKATRNLGYAQITSPVDGTVIAKEVEVGQTVAASFSTPTLFSIAEDLKKMQIETSISEADIGSVRKGMPVSFTVDAYPADTFTGEIEQIRLKPATESNVVIYTVIINIGNEDKRLLPGMTAFVDINVAEANNVLVLPKSALQFTLPISLKDLVTGIPDSSKLNFHQAIVYQLQEGKIKPIIIDTGISDDSLVEVTGGLKKGDRVISEYSVNKKKKKAEDGYDSGGSGF